MTSVRTRRSSSRGPARVDVRLLHGLRSKTQAAPTYTMQFCTITAGPCADAGRDRAEGPGELIFVGRPCRKPGAQVLMCCCQGERASAHVRTSKIRIRLKAFDHHSSTSRPATSSRQRSATGAKVAGPIPLPTHISRYTVLRTARRQEVARAVRNRTHKRLLDISSDAADARRAHEARPVGGPSTSRSKS